MSKSENSNDKEQIENIEKLKQVEKKLEELPETIDDIEAIEEKEEEKKEDKKKKRREKKSKKQKKKDKEKEQDIDKQILDLNVYNLLYDEIIAFLNELPNIPLKTLRRRLILLDGKMIWLEKQTEEDLFEEKGSDEIIDFEMEMLEQGMDLESADEIKDVYSTEGMEFDLDSYKEIIEEGKTFGQSIKDIMKDIEMDDVDKPVEDLMSKFILYDLRAFIERSINSVFKLEGKIKKLSKANPEDNQIKILQADQKKAVKTNLTDMANKLKKEKPKMILTEERINEFKNLDYKKILELKAKEEKEFEDMVGDILKE
ncbi:MAG: hypothetical protein FK734_01870 [Asgard group archaeon]|nr:hypothetical protein [Asgard group archaeon]